MIQAYPAYRLGCVMEEPLYEQGVPDQIDFGQISCCAFGARAGEPDERVCSWVREWMEPDRHYPRGRL